MRATTKNHNARSRSPAFPSGLAEAALAVTNRSRRRLFHDPARHDHRQAGHATAERRTRRRAHPKPRLAWAALAAILACLAPQAALPAPKAGQGGKPDYWTSRAYESELQEYWFYVRQRNEAAYDVSVALELSPCRCDIWRIARGMGWMARMRHGLDDRIRRILNLIREKYPPVIRELALEAEEARRMGRSKAALALLKILEAAAVDALDMTFQFGTAANELGAMRKSAETMAARSRELAEKAHRATRGSGKVAAGAAYQGGGGPEALAQSFPELAQIGELYQALAAWAKLGESIAATERRLWKDILASKPCRELLGGAVEASPNLDGLLRQDLAAKDFVTRAGAAVAATCQLGRTATAGGERGGCELRSALDALRKLYLIYQAARRHEGELLRHAATLQKGIMDQYRAIVRMYARAGEGSDWLKFWTGAEGWSGWAEILLSLVPLGGTAIAAGHVTGETIAQARFRKVHREIEEHIRKARGWLDDTNRQIKALGKLRDRIKRCERALWDRLRECSAKVPCEEPGKDVVAVPREGGVRVAGDSGKWCSYWGWKKEVPWFPEGGVVVPREEPREKDKGRPRPDGEGTPDFPKERRPVTVERPRKPKRRPQPEGEPQPERPPIYVKAKKAAVREGAKAQAVAGFQLKLLAPAPPLPLAGNRRDDSGYDEPPLQATTGRDGTAVLPGTRGRGNERSARPAPRRFALSFGDLIAEAHAAEHDGPARPVTVEFEVPEFESYVVKIRIDRSRPGWNHPASYLDPPFDGYVVRHWIVGEIMYAVVNVPTVADAPGEARK